MTTPFNKTHEPLPIDSYLPAVAEEIKTHIRMIVSASAGSGKTTRIPPYLLGQSFDFLVHKKILVLEPRQLAASLSAIRVAQEMQESVGQRVGYQFRFNHCVSAHTQLIYMTEGLFFKMLPNNRFLNDVGVIVLDEFHERHLETDAVLAYVLWLQKTHRPDLRLIVMSATIELERLKQFLEPCVVIEQYQKIYPLTISYQERLASVSLPESVGRAFISLHAQHKIEDVLVFLPGLAEIKACHAHLKTLLDKQFCSLKYEICQLHASLKESEQSLPWRDHTDAQGQRIRKVILATNIAETSLTFMHVNAVIDSGLHKAPRYSQNSGFMQLLVKPIPQDSAIQRAARAARRQPGYCVRLYSEYDFKTRLKTRDPDIKHADLSALVLDLIGLSVPLEKTQMAETNAFVFYDPPPAAHIQVACDLLFGLGAIQKNESGFFVLTAVGQWMQTLSMHPRLSLFLVSCMRLGVFKEGIQIAAALQENQVDSLDIRDVLAQKNNHKKVQQVCVYLHQRVQSLLGDVPLDDTFLKTKEERLCLALLKAYFDRVIQPVSCSNGIKSNTLKQDFILSSGGQVVLEKSSINDVYGYAVALETDYQASRKQFIVKTIAPIQEEWLLDLPAHLCKENEFIKEDTRTGQVFCVSQLLYQELVLSESRQLVQDERATQYWLKYWFGKYESRLEHVSYFDVLEVFRHEKIEETMTPLLAKIKLLVQYQPDLMSSSSCLLKDLSLWQMICLGMQGVYQREDLQSSDFSRLFMQRLLGESNAAEVERLLPNIITIKKQIKTLKRENPAQHTHARMPIHYSLDTTPYVAAKLQEFYGYEEVPTLLNGRLRLTVHLLAPNQRAVQTTQDLKSFWIRTYPTLRTQLMRLYPRHVWPE